MMDRERAYIPRLQIEFIDLITLPVYRKVLSLSILTNLAYLVMMLMQFFALWYLPI